MLAIISGSLKYRAICLRRVEFRGPRSCCTAGKIRKFALTHRLAHIRERAYLSCASYCLQGRFLWYSVKISLSVCLHIFFGEPFGLKWIRNNKVFSQKCLLLFNFSTLRISVITMNAAALILQWVLYLKKILVLSSVLFNLPSLFMPAWMHLARRHARHWFRCVLSTMHPPSDLVLQTYWRFLRIDLLKKPAHPSHANIP